MVARRAGAGPGAAWLLTLASCSSVTTVEVAPHDASAGPTFVGDDGAQPSPMCKTSAACLPGRVCCGTVMLTGTCQLGPCRDLGGVGPIQLCGMSAECLAPADTCGPPSMPILVNGITICNPPEDPGTGADAWPGADASRSEASSSDEASPGEDASPSDGGKSDDSDTSEVDGG
jgi:hypothetical protein